MVLLLGVLVCVNYARSSIEESRRARPALVLAEPPAPATPRPKRALSYYSVILDRDIFNPPRPPDPPRAAKPAPLKARLLGTAPAAGDGEAYAVIEDTSNGQQALYRLGGVLQGRAITRIDWDEIALDGGAAEEVLTVPVPRSQLAALLRASGEDLARGSVFVLRPSVPLAPQPESPVTVASLRTEPVFVKGRPAGIRISEIPRGSALEKLGLRDGDVVRRVGDTDLTDPLQAIPALASVHDAKGISMEILRANEPLTLPQEAQPASGGVELDELIQARAAARESQALVRPTVATVAVDE